jgi:tetratricopeptide (TPR) repeat protein
MRTRRKHTINLRLAIIMCFDFAVSYCYSQHKDQVPHVVVNDIIYMKDDTLKSDFYLPNNYRDQENPVLIFIDGFGSDFRKWDHYKDWAKFAASEGFVGVVYSSRKDFVRESFEGVLSFLSNQSDKYFVDTGKISVYAGSGNVLQGLPLANADNRIKAALIYYGTAKIEQFRLDMPVLLVRAGLDNIPLNKQLDSLAFKALAANAPYTVTNLNTSRHAFEDINDLETKTMMAASLDFLKVNMGKAWQEKFLKNEHEVIAMRELYKSNWNRALDALNLALKNSPGNNEIERQVGNVYVELNEYEKAISSFNAALTHGNWRKGEIAQKKLYAYAKLDSIDAAVAEMRILKRIGWFREDDYAGKEEFTKIMKSKVYEEFDRE